MTFSGLDKRVHRTEYVHSGAHAVAHSVRCVREHKCLGEIAQIWLFCVPHCGVGGASGRALRKRRSWHTHTLDGAAQWRRQTVTACQPSTVRKKKKRFSMEFVEMRWKKLDQNSQSKNSPSRAHSTNSDMLILSFQWWNYRFIKIFRLQFFFLCLRFDWPDSFAAVTARAHFVLQALSAQCARIREFAFRLCDLNEFQSTNVSFFYISHKCAHAIGIWQKPWPWSSMCSVQCAQRLAQRWAERWRAQPESA